MKDKYDDIDEYIHDLQEAIEASGGECAAHHYNLGLALLSKRDFVGAEESFLAALKESPHMAEAMVQLGGICLQRGDLDGCMNYNKEAAAIRPKFAIAESNIAFVYLQLRDPKKAISHVDRALRWDPSFLQARNVLATAEYMLGNYEKCAETCRLIVKEEPGFGPAWMNLSLSLFELGDIAGADEAVKKAAASGFEVNPDYLKELEARKA